jgi:UDP-glucuronate decarboxylase
MNERYTLRKRVVVTGGAGFIGSHLCRRLAAEGNDVLCVDNFYTGTRDNVADLLENPRFELLRHDVTFPLYVEADEIYNLACPASPVHYQYRPVQTTKTSVHGAINMLGLAKRLRAKILQASTSEVYGDPTEHPQTEEYWGNVNPIGPRACYDEGKRCAETLFFDYLRQHDLEIKVARIFNTYGPCMHPNDGRVVSNFIMQALRRESITVYGDGTQTRSFCYVSDMVDGLVRLMQSPREVSGPVNLGNPKEFTMRELAGMITDLCGGESQLEFRPLPADDPRQRRPDITRAQGLLGWQPTIPLAEGLRPTIEYFRRFVDVPSKDFLHSAESVIGMVERRETIERDEDQSRSGVGGEQRRECAGPGISTVPSHKRGYPERAAEPGREASGQPR